MKLRYPMILATIALSLAACGTPPNPGYTQVRTDAKPFPEAHRECWASSMAIEGGVAVEMPRLTAYQRCMERDGWRDERRVFPGH